MRFKTTDFDQKGTTEMSMEIKPNWKRAGVIALLVMGIFAFIASSQYLLQAQKAHAADLMYRDIMREWPRQGSLVYVPFGIDNTCLHLARFDPGTGYFYDDTGWLEANKWLYVTDRWPAEIETCTTEDN